MIIYSIIIVIGVICILGGLLKDDIANMDDDAWWKEYISDYR